MKEKEKLAMADPEQTYADIRRAGEVHRIVRQYAQRTIKPGMSLTACAELIEDATRACVAEDGLNAGIGFPTGVNLNNCAAHFTPNVRHFMFLNHPQPRRSYLGIFRLGIRQVHSRRLFSRKSPLIDVVVLQASDVMKVDFGVHVNGRIVDSAFTMSFEPTYDQLTAAVKAATNAGVKVSSRTRAMTRCSHLQMAGIDVRLSEIGAEIQEVMESYEVVIGSNTYPGKSALE